MESMLLKASAGSGKTTRLTKEALNRILDGARFIVALTFTRAATTEMRSRIVREIAERKDLNILERLRQIMEAGRVNYSTIDAFFYRLFAAAGFIPKLADEKEQIEITREIEQHFRELIKNNELLDKIITAARVLGADIDKFWEQLAQEQTIERCVKDSKRLNDLEKLIKENAVLKNKLKVLYEKAETLRHDVAKRVQDWVISAMSDYGTFVSKTAAKHADLETYESLGKTINWDNEPYCRLNAIFKEYRKIAESLCLNKALLRELAVASLCELYLKAAERIKNEKGLIFFQDVRRALLALDGAEEKVYRPQLMSLYFSLGLDRTEHLLIDEFQDTSKGDIQILLPLIDEVLSGGGERGRRSFFAVGDWKQMIYGWRGADREALEDAIRTYLKNGIIKESLLEFNYRSTPLLISFFNELVAHLYTGKEKEETQTPPEKPREYCGITEVNCVQLEKNGSTEESFYPSIVEYLKKKKKEYACQWGEMVVLALTNNHVQKIEAELIKNGVAVAAVKGRQLLATTEGVAVMLFLAVLLGENKEDKFISAAVNSALWKGFWGDIGPLREELEQKYPKPYGLMAVSYALELLRGKIPSTILDIWQEEAQAFYAAGRAGVDEFLARMFEARISVKVPEAEKTENIKVDTIHGTKGLQFKHVFIFWNEEERAAPFYLASQRCHVQFSREEIEFHEAGNSAAIREIVENYRKSLEKMRREKANVFYVAATRAMQTLTVFLPKTKSENYKPVHKAILKTFEIFALEGSKQEIYAGTNAATESETVAILSVKKPAKGEPEKYGEIDPALLAANIKAGIMRGERLHRWLARVVDAENLPPAGELSKEEYQAAVGFVKREEVAAIMFRSGRVYVEQQISDKDSFGIVDRMIVSDDLVTIIDYKSGSMSGLKQKYEEQLKRYTKIMKNIYPQKRIEYFILSIDA